MNKELRLIIVCRSVNMIKLETKLKVLVSACAKGLNQSFLLIPRRAQQMICWWGKSWSRSPVKFGCYNAEGGRSLWCWAVSQISGGRGAMPASESSRWENDTMEPSLVWLRRSVVAWQRCSRTASELTAPVRNRLRTVPLLSEGICRWHQLCLSGTLSSDSMSSQTSMLANVGRVNVLSQVLACITSPIASLLYMQIQRMKCN